MSELRPPYRLDKTLTLGLVFTVMVQTASGLIWAGAVGARLKNLESQTALHASVLERLARLETQTDHIGLSLDRIEKRLAAND